MGGLTCKLIRDGSRSVTYCDFMFVRRGLNNMEGLYEHKYFLVPTGIKSMLEFSHMPRLLISLALRILSSTENNLLYMIQHR